MMNHNLSTFMMYNTIEKFGFIIYFKDKNDMYEMMEQEIHSLFQYKLISKDEYLKSRLIINQRRNE